MITQLADELKAVIPKAKAAYIAVALMKQYGLDIFKKLPENCIQRFLIGIDLPTPPSILSDLLNKQVETKKRIEVKLHNTQSTYHPKVYLFELQDGEYVAFIGSANATKGGLTTNIELSIALHGKDCEKIKDWFDVQYRAAEFYNNEFIERYKLTYQRNRILRSTQTSNLKAMNRVEDTPYVYPLINEGQFFIQSDFDALAPKFHFDKTDSIKGKRKEVQKHILNLHDAIYDRFSEFGLTNISKHHNKANITSLPNHNGRTKSNRKEAIWLHYGKTDEELALYPEEQQSVSYHVRLQLIVRHSKERASIGIWLYLGKSHSSLDDRKWLIDQFKNDSFEDVLLAHLLALGGSYWIWFVDENVDDFLYVSEIKDAKDLRRFLLKDKEVYGFSKELIIGRDYDPNDPAFSRDEIEETVLVEFSKLYKIYNLVKHNPSST
jgi:HKD family nuclease